VNVTSVFFLKISLRMLWTDDIAMATNEGEVRMFQAPFSHVSMPPAESAAGQVVWRHSYCHSVAREDHYVSLPHLPSQRS